MVVYFPLAQVYWNGMRPKSQQMVAEELARIVHIAEATTRVRLENQLGELKVVKIAHIVLLIVLYIMCLYVSVHPRMCLCVSSVLGGALLST